MLFSHMYFLYMDDCRNLCEGRHILKFTDDIGITSLLQVQGHKTECGSVVEEFLQESGEKYFRTVMCPDQRK